MVCVRVCVGGGRDGCVEVEWDGMRWDSDRGCRELAVEVWCAMG